MKIGMKLIVGFLAVAVIAAVVGIVGIFNIRTIDQADTALYEKMTVPTGQIALVGVACQRIRVNVRDAMEQDVPAEQLKAWNTIWDLEKEIRAQAALFEKTILTDAVRKEFKEFETAFNRYLEHAHKMKDLQAAGKMDAAYALMRGESAQEAKIVRESLASMLDKKLERAKETSDQNAQTATQATTIMIIIAALGAIIAFVLGLLITISITRPLNLGVIFAQKIADGDLTARVDVHSKDEIGILANALNEAVSKLNGAMRGVLEASMQVKSASEQIAKGNQDLSSRTEAQASSVEETAASMEEMATSIKQNTSSAQAVNSLSEEASTKANQGVAVVKEVTGAMEAINDSSKKIASIVEVMNTIAFQTNLLALNASIEAARAGEQGRGFAVVAVEVRKLAQRSDEASKEIASLVSESSQKVENGHVLVRKAGESLDDISNSVGKVKGLISEITAASQEQLTGVEEINKTIIVLDQNTQQNASLVEEQASMAEELSGQAQELHALVSTFQVGGDHAVAVVKKVETRTPVAHLPAPEKKSPSTHRAAGHAKAAPASKPKGMTVHSEDAQGAQTKGKAPDGFVEF